MKRRISGITLKRNIRKILGVLTITAIGAGFLFKRDVQAATFAGADMTVSASSISTFSSIYLKNIPAGLRAVYEADGGVFIILQTGNSNTATTDASGWSSGNTVTGSTNLNGAAPIISLSSRTVDLANRYLPNTSRKVLCHEFGHYVCAKANQVRYGTYSYTMTPKMAAAFAVEKNNYMLGGISQTLTSSLSRTVSIEEYYANIFAGLMTEPSKISKICPASCAAVNADIALVCGK